VYPALNAVGRFAVTEDEMDALTGGTTNKSEKIRLLNAAGVSTADIARYLTTSTMCCYAPA
jgi:hypothetical protein